MQLWNCFSYYPSVHCFSFLRGKRGKYFGKDKKDYPGEYLFTIDWGHPESNILKKSLYHSKSLKWGFLNFWVPAYSLI